MMFQSIENYMIDRSKTFFRKEIGSEILFEPKSELSQKDAPIEYFWTRNPKILKEYIKLIDERFRDEINVKDSYKKINDNDFESYFYVAAKVDELVLGVRLSIVPPGGINLLPTENEGFNYKEFFSELDLEKNGYAELTRYSVNTKYRNQVNYDRGFKSFKELCDEKNIKYLFLPGSGSRQRLYKAFAGKYFKYIDIKKFNIAILDGQDDALDAKDFWFYAYENI